MSKFFKALFVVGMSLAMVTPAFASFSIYGSARFHTTWIHTQVAKEAPVLDNGTHSFGTLHYTLADNSRFGAKMSNGDFSGRVEIGMEGNQDGNGLYTRLLFGVWKFDGGNLLIGQTYTPYTFFTDQVYYDDNGNIGFGALYDSRQPMIKVTMDNGVYLAAIQPKAYAVDPAIAGTVKYFAPKVAVGYNTKIQNFTIGGGIAYDGFTVENVTSKTVNSYLLYLHGTADFKPIDVRYAFSYGQNLLNFGLYSRRSAGVTVDADGQLKNSQGWGGLLQVGAQVASNAKVNVGAGYVHDSQTGEKAAQSMTAFINAPIKIAKTFSFIPEFDYFHYLKTVSSVPGLASPNAKNAWALGAKWQMDF